MTAIREASYRSGKRTQVLRDARTQPFVTWVERGGFKADREPIDFTTWKHLRPIYASVPQSIEDLVEWSLCLMASAQNGKSIILLLLSVWLGLRVELMRGGYYLPTDRKATDFSDNRWMGLVRDNPSIHRLMGDPEDPHERQIIDEGAMSIRKLWRSLWYFFSIFGKISTESTPMDGVLFDEVHQMPLGLIEKAEHRLDASKLKIRCYGSTGGFEGADIDFFFQQSDQRWFHTACACPDGVILAKCIDAQDGPVCIDRGNGTTPGVPREYFYVCPKCHTMIPDPQVGQYVAHRTDVFRRTGFQFPQMLSPRQSARSILEKWRKRISTQDYFNRVGGLGFTDPTTVPINDLILEAAQNPDLRWGPPTRRDVDAVFMGVDQRAHEHHIIIKGKVGDRQRVLHVEDVQAAKPFKRARELLRDYHVKFTCLEAAPNLDDAYEFANEFPGRVFVVNAYHDLSDAVLRWADRATETATERRTADEFKTPFVVTVDRYKMMSLALNRWAKGGVETPDARTLLQKLRTPDGVRDVMICREMLWKHLKSIALVQELVGGEKKADELKYRNVVKKIGPDDPHLAFANMLCDVAWARAYGTDLMLSEEFPVARREPEVPVKPKNDAIRSQIADQLSHYGVAEEKPPALTCGDCAQFDADQAYCTLRTFYTPKSAPQCEEFIAKIEEDPEWH